MRTPASTLASCMMPLLFVAALNAEDVVLAIDDGKPLHSVAERFNGNNFVALWNSTGDTPGTRKAVGQMGLGLLRFPGGCPCQWWDWEQPLNTGWSSMTQDTAWSFAQNSGAEMIFQTNTVNDGEYDDKIKGGKSKFDSSGAHAAAWVKAANAAGIKVAFWEIGNEPEMDGPHKENLDQNYAWYNAKYTEQVQAIREVDPKARVMGPAATNVWFWWHEKTIEKFMLAHGDKKGDSLADAVSIHWYPGGGDGPWEERRGTAQGWQSCWDYLHKTLTDLDSRALPLYITEWNWGSGDKNTSAYGLGNGLGCADCVGMFLRTGVAGHTHFCLQKIDHGWGVLAMKGEPRSENSASPTFFALSMAARMGQQVLPLTNPADEANVLSAYATKDKTGGMQVMLINKSDHEIGVSTSFTSFKPEGKQALVYTLTGATGKIGDSEVIYNEMPSPKPSEEELPPPKPMKIDKALARQLPPYSLTVIVFPGAALPPPAAPKPSLTPAERKALQAATEGATARTIQRAIKGGGQAPSTIIDFNHQSVTGTVQSATEEDVTVRLQEGSMQLPWTTLQPASYHAIARSYASRDNASVVALTDFAALCVSIGAIDQAKQTIAKARLASTASGKKDGAETLDLLQHAAEVAETTIPAAPKPAPVAAAAAAAGKPAPGTKTAAKPTTSGKVAPATRPR